MAVTVLEPGERFELKMGEVSFSLAPLTYMQKSQISSHSTIENGETVRDSTMIAFMSVKYAVKDFKGLQLPNGQEYKPEFDEKGCLTDECADAILNIPMCISLLSVCQSLIAGIPTEVTDRFGRKVDGVEIVFGEGGSKKKSD